MRECIFSNRRKSVVAILLILTAAAAPLFAQTTQRTGAPQVAPTPNQADIPRGEYGRYRANNDLLFYHLDIRVDPEKKFVNGKNTIRFKMLKDDTRIQLDLYDNLKVDKILFRSQKSEARGQKSDVLKYERDSGAVFVDFPETLKAGRVYLIDFYYSGTPQTIGRFGNGSLLCGC